MSNRFLKRFCMLPLIALLLSLAYSAGAQSMISKEWIRRQAEKTIEKKFRTPIETFYDKESALLAIREKTGPNHPAMTFARSEEGNVSNSEEAESEIHAAINPVDSNNIIVGAMRYGTGGLLGVSLEFPIYYTRDFGQTWKLSKFDGVSDLGPTTFVAGGGDPIIVFDREGVAYLSWLTVTVDLTFQFRNTLHLARSTDGGATWKRLKNIDAGEIEDILNFSGGRFVDKEWMAADRSNSPYQDNIYVAYAEIDLTDTTYNILVQTKSPDSLGFHTKVDVTPPALAFSQFTSIDVDNEGTVHLLFSGATLEDSLLNLFHVKSVDGGRTFTEPTLISSLYLDCFPPQPGVSCSIVGIDSARVYPSPHLRVDRSGGPYDGVLYAVWTANGVKGPERAGMDIYYSRSEDGGSSWARPIILNNDPKANLHQFFPSLAVNDDGVLAITWYDRRNDPENLLTDYYMTISKDGGQTFSDDFTISSEAADFSKIGLSNANFGVGEYTQVVVTSGFAIPFWADGRTNDGNVEIFSAFIPLDQSQTTDLTETGNITEKFSVRGPSPNPAPETANLEIKLQERSAVHIRIIDPAGRLLVRMDEAELLPGDHSFTLDVKSLPAGHYWCHIQTDHGFRTKPLVIVR